MIPHHAAAAAMARLELSRGSHPQLKALAQRIITDQNREITQMTGWLHTWYGVTPAQAQDHAPAGLKRMAATMDAQMSTMTKRLTTVPRGSRFDQAFLTGMIAHHKMAAIEAGTVSGRADHPQLSALARQIVASQNTEITQMTDWLHTWYGTRLTTP
jgi:uncharacterized protein (DUF305 family)